MPLQVSHQPVRTTHTATGAIRCDGIAVVELPDGTVTDAEVDLRGGRHRFHVGGRVREGFRWWYGWITLPDDARVSAGDAIVLRLGVDRSSTATIERVTGTVPGRVAIRGIGRPPFDVP